MIGNDYWLIRWKEGALCKKRWGCDFFSHRPSPKGERRSFSSGQQVHFGVNHACK